MRLILDELETGRAIQAAELMVRQAIRRARKHQRRRARIAQDEREGCKANERTRRRRMRQLKAGEVRFGAYME